MPDSKELRTARCARILPGAAISYQLDGALDVAYERAMTPRIAHVLSSLAIGGQERVALDLAASQIRAGYHVTALSLAPLPEGPLAAEFRAAGVAVECVARPRP